MIPLHDKNRICPKCVCCHINTTRHARHFPHPVCGYHEPWSKLILMEARWCDPGCVPSHGAHPCGSASVPGAIATLNSGVGIPQGGHPGIKREMPMIVLIKIITKCWYSLIVQNTLFFLYRNLTFAQVYMRILFLKSNSQSTNINLKWNVVIKNKIKIQTWNIKLQLCVFKVGVTIIERKKEKRQLYTKW